MNTHSCILMATVAAVAISCSNDRDTSATPKIHSLAVVDPGHFHAALVTKSPVANINDTIRLYAPEGPEVKQYSDFINSYNARTDNPTSWVIAPNIGGNYFNAFRADTVSDIVVLAGNNRHKTDYILAAIEAGKNVLADKPMAIDKDGFEKLAKAYEKATDNGQAIYELMTERYDTLNIMTRQLLADTVNFGTLVTADTGTPSVVMESVHHFYKEVSGSPLTRPAWYYDVEQQGEGIADVTTHLIDLIMWQCFPGQVIDYKNDVEVIDAAHTATIVTPEQFHRSTGCIIDQPLEVYSNGYILARIKDIIVKLNVRWDFEAPQGSGDTFAAIYTGTKGMIHVSQDETTDFSKEVFFIDSVGVSTHQEVPASARLGHEDHFNCVTASFLQILDGARMPEWETANTLAKYRITTDAVTKAREKE